MEAQKPIILVLCGISLWGELMRDVCDDRDLAWVWTNDIDAALAQTPHIEAAVIQATVFAHQEVPMGFPGRPFVFMSDLLPQPHLEELAREKWPPGVEPICLGEAEEIRGQQVHRPHLRTRIGGAVRQLLQRPVVCARAKRLGLILPTSGESPVA